jgi:hypothetical protein
VGHENVIGGKLVDIDVLREFVRRDIGIEEQRSVPHLNRKGGMSIVGQFHKLELKDSRANIHRRFPEVKQRK